MKKSTKSKRQRQPRSPRSSKKPKQGTDGRVVGLREQIREALMAEIRSAVAKTAGQIVEDEATSLVGEPWSRKGDSPLRRNGQTTTTIFLDGEPHLLQRPRIRDQDVGSGASNTVPDTLPPMIRHRVSGTNLPAIERQSVRLGIAPAVRSPIPTAGGRSTGARRRACRPARILGALCVGLLTGPLTGTIAAGAPASNAQQGWEPAGPARKRRAERWQLHRVREAGRGELSVVDGVLERRIGGERVLLGCTYEQGTGRVLDLAADPFGPTFVAAEHGLFVTSPDVQILDRITLGPGAPPGRLTSIACDRERRIWIATEQAFGVIDSITFSGQTFGEQDGLPPSGPYRVTLAADGSLLVAAGDRLQRYLPDLGQPPPVTSFTLDGESAEQRASTSPVYLEATANGTGQPVVRYRVDGHHIWSPLASGGTELRLSPGAHRIEVIALDRDLQPSQPLSLSVYIRYPFYYSQAFVVGLAALFGVATGVFFLSSAAREQGVRPRYGRALLSSAVALTFALQILAGLIPHAQGWPFVGFSMYSSRYDAGDVVYNAVVLGLGPGERKSPIQPQALGAGHNRWQLLRPLVAGGDETAGDFLARIRARYPRRFLRGFQVEAQRTRLTPRGPVPVAPIVLRRYLPEAIDAGS